MPKFWKIRRLYLSSNLVLTGLSTTNEEDVNWGHFVEMYGICVVMCIPLFGLLYSCSRICKRSVLVMLYSKIERRVLKSVRIGYNAEYGKYLKRYDYQVIQSNAHNYRDNKSMEKRDD